MVRDTTSSGSILFYNYTCSNNYLFIFYVIFIMIDFFLYFSSLLSSICESTTNLFLFYSTLQKTLSINSYYKFLSIKNAWYEILEKTFPLFKWHGTEYVLSSLLYIFYDRRKKRKKKKRKLKYVQT